MFCYENEMVFPNYVSDQKFENSALKMLAHLCFIKQKIKNDFVEVVYNALVVKVC